MLSESDVLKKSPMEIYQILDSRFGTVPWLGFYPATILAHYPNLEGTAVAADKLLAVHAIASDAGPVCREAAVFEKVCDLFSNNPIVMGTSQPLFIEEVFYGVDQIKKIIGAAQDFDYMDPSVEIFHGEVPAYVATAAHNDDVYLLPSQLAFAQQLLTHLSGREPTEAEAELVVALSDKADTADTTFLDTLGYGDEAVARLMGCSLFKPAGVSLNS